MVLSGYNRFFEWQRIHCTLLGKKMYQTAFANHLPVFDFLMFRDISIKKERPLL